ncbi:MAG: methyltransferase [Euryarchaeota archaeon]|nr:methyltransferase [Euryarchaeota archaeon]
MRYRQEIDIVECENVYPPMEDTFLLLGVLEIHPDESVLEMGPGTGLITCHLAASAKSVIAADVNPMAVECTEANLRRNELSGDVRESDLFQNISEQFDLIVFNPPYCPGTEDDNLALAWAGGPDGTEVVDRFLNRAPEHLLPNGRIILLLSTEMNQIALETILRPFQRIELGRQQLFFEEIWVEELRPLEP